jgi:hypothetical protein
MALHLGLSVEISSFWWSELRESSEDGNNLWNVFFSDYQVIDKIQKEKSA